MKKSKNSITIAIPAYNEEECIGMVIKDTFENLPKYFKDYEVIAVDDGSNDNTGKILDKLATKYKYLKVIHQPNGGYSKAMLAGIMASEKDFVAYMPADGQFLINDMRHCFESMTYHDMVLGYRGGRPDYTTKRMIFSFGYLLLLTLLFNIKFMDVGWVVIWKTEKIKGLKLKYTKGIFLLAESVIRFQNAKYKIVEAPSYYRPRKAGEVKNAKLKVVLDTFVNAFRLWWEVKIMQSKLC